MILNMLRGILAATAITLASAAPVPTPVPDARVLPATAQPASITLGTVSSSNITATIVPSAADVGSTQTVWMGAIFQGTLYLRNGTAWQPYTGGNYPVAIQSQPLAASTTINVVNNLDISGLIGLQLYVGFGTSQMDMFTAPGKLALIYTVPAPQLTAISLATSLAAGSSAHISPVPSAATLGSCSSNNTSVATVSGNTVTAVNPGTVTITCSGQSAILVVTSAPLTGISLAPSSLAVGSQSQVSAQPSNASLGSCTSSNPSVASVTGSLVTANNAGTATITCSGKSAVITVTAPSCAQTAAGTYSGSISGSYSGSATLALTQQSGLLYDVTGSISINGLGTVSATGQSDLPTVNLVGYCSSGGGAFECFSASGTVNNGTLDGSYTTADGGSGSFNLTKACS